MKDRINKLIPSFPEAIEIRKNTKGITQQVVADYLGISQVMVYRIESYHNQTLKLNRLISYIDAINELKRNGKNDKYYRGNPRTNG